MVDSELRSVEQHQRAILDDLEPMGAVAMPLLDALDLACAEEVVAQIALPSFDNSAMDGYAVRFADVEGASAQSPVTLPVVGEIGAGQAKLTALGSGAAAKIMTGAPVPTGADAVVPYEWTDRGADVVRIEQAPRLGQHIRPAGDDVTVGDLLVEEGADLGPRRLGLLASVGRATVMARPRPRVVILSTGSELRDPGRALGHDSIYDGNSYLLAAAARRVGAIPYRVGIIPDQPEAFLEALADQLVRADILVTSGGVSQGDFDVVKAALAPQGVWFGPVAMQPGKPQGYGRVGEDQVPIFTLPGNPVSAYISFQVFVLPALRKLMGKRPHVLPTRSARLTGDLTSPPAKRQYRRGDLVFDGTGLSVAPVGGPGSHLVGDLASANCLIVIPESTTSIAAGESVEVLMLEESP
ncbi:gephyrin-like molybdotransferase Glp [Nocardioides sp.]|uniref:molybdotransferase-like divisome protein Glp n=1 Tax=Nocardioides sp. TaxID=35761 RepID=UPI003562D65D